MTVGGSGRAICAALLMLGILTGCTASRASSGASGTVSASPPAVASGAGSTTTTGTPVQSSGSTAASSVTSGKATAKPSAGESSSPAAQSGAPSGSGTASDSSASLPTTPAGHQAAWFLGELARLPISAGDADAHFDSQFLAALPAARLNVTLATIGPLQVVSITSSTPARLLFTASSQVGKLDVAVSVDGAGKINGLRLAPAGTLSSTAPSIPGSWAGVDAAVTSVGPDVEYLAAEVNGRGCRAIHGIAASTVAPLGSAFKLIVLDALARTVDAGTVTWDQQLTVTNNVKSLPSGQLQSKPTGTRVSVEQAATLMISISDNTAADMLIGLVSRRSIEHAMTAAGITDPARNIPFPTTRELFQLKLRDWPRLANRYLAADSGGRSGILTSLDPLALPAASPWTTPRHIDTLEWFASPTDICKLYADLMALAARPSLTPLNKILSANTGEIPVDAKDWPTIWFKGGSEPGVLTLNYLATSGTGKTYVVSLMVADPNHPLPDSATASLLAAAAGALHLAKT